MHTVRSSHGEFTIDKHGNVTEHRPEDASTDDAKHHAQIFKFDVYEWMQHWKTGDLPDCFDILDLAYWYNDSYGHPAFVRPDEVWRKDIAEDLLKRRKGDTGHD